MGKAAERETDVLVVGGGIAGVMAAWSAAQAGARVALACTTHVFSGSSFFGGTWGLGLVGPHSDDDIDDLVRTICEVGCGMANERLVRSFVRGITPSIAMLEGLGMELERPEREGEREFIPCFDHTTRAWYGLRREAFEGAMRPALEEAGVTLLEGRELVDLLDVASEHGVAGALLLDRHAGAFETVRASATVLATGGFGTLFERRLTSPDALGCAQAIALRHGTSLTNLEFFQIMPGIVSPRRGIVFNEKTFRMARLRTPDGREPFAPNPDASPNELLELRSGHGPFTSRLASRAVDLAVDACGDEGMAVTYPGLAESLVGGTAPEFVRTFAEWLSTSCKVSPDDELRIAPYAHAANGGIVIDEHGRTSITGLYAAGECTGGMHGADRIGGLASANGLVFGLRAGKEAARHAAESGLCETIDASLPQTASPEADELDQAMRQVMSRVCMVTRTEQGLQEGIGQLNRLANRLDDTAVTSEDAIAITRTQRTRNRLLLAQLILEAALERRESRGSHYRSDFPEERAAYARPSFVTEVPDSGGI